MTVSRLFTALLAVFVLAATAPLASADTSLFKEDAEGPIEAQWTVTPATDTTIQPWQKSDSSTLKARQNQAHGGSTSFWTGESPPWDPVNVVKGDSIMTTKKSIAIPADGVTTLDYWSLFQNEGDDIGAAEVAVDNNGTPGPWKALVKEAATNTAAGDSDDRICQAAQQQTLTVGFSEQKVKLATYAGQKIFLRFNLKYGAENRAASQPCGWYVDDIAINTTGTPGATLPPPTPPVTAPVLVKPSVTFGKLKGKKKKASLGITINGSDLKNIVVTVFKGKKKLGTGKAAGFAPGTHQLALKFSKAYKKKTKYTVKLTAVGSDGAKYSASKSVKGG